jgi:hypothetical protein
MLAVTTANHTTLHTAQHTELLTSVLPQHGLLAHGGEQVHQDLAHHEVVHVLAGLHAVLHDRQQLVVDQLACSRGREREERSGEEGVRVNDVKVRCASQQAESAGEWLYDQYNTAFR